MDIMAQNTENRALNDKFMLRLPDGMRDRIKAAAEHNGRSMNAEIVQALDYWLEIELPYDVQLGAGTDAKSVGQQDWEESREEHEKDYRREIERSIFLMQRLLKDLSVTRGTFPELGSNDGASGDS